MTLSFLTFFKTKQPKIRSVHSSISTIPLLKFNEVIKTGDLSKLIIKGVYSTVELKKAWESLYDEYIKEFGLPAEYKAYLNLKVQAAEELVEIYVNGQEYRRAFYNIYMREAEALMKQKGASLGKTIAVLTKYMGVRIDPNVITVLEYYSYLRELEEENGRKQSKKRKPI